MTHEHHVPGSSIMVEATGLGKRYGDFWALRDFDLHVASGTILGLLGHNGAGKTTAIRMLTTIAAPSAGSASIAGHDVVKAADDVRRSIGVAAQRATVDGLLSARMNLEMLGRLYKLDKREARRRADSLLEQVELADVADKLVKEFSGGMRRRLDLAAALVNDPPVIFLDEPTTGLDPHSRNGLWEIVRARRDAGAAIVLTTQYLEEADQLADDIVLLDHGTTVARGTPEQLKERIGGERIVAAVDRTGDIDAAASALREFATGEVTRDEATHHGREVIELSAPVPGGLRIVEVVRALDSAGADVVDVGRRQPTLDDVFLALTSFDGPDGNAGERVAVSGSTSSDSTPAEVQP